MLSSLSGPPAVPLMPPEDQERVRAQMERLLQSAHFRNSKRYPTLLRYIVEEALAGRGPHLKERTLGVEVFGRAADYETSSDPIVRVTVAEIRKRIAQYYHEDAHGSELRIELNPGSYIPEFLPGREGEPEPLREPIVVPPVEQKPTAHDAPRPTHTSLRMYGLAAAVLVVIVLAAGLWRSLRPSPIDALWSPFFASSGPITFCLPVSVPKHGVGSANTTDEAIEHALDFGDARLPVSGTFFDHEVQGENVVYSDVLAMMKLESVIEPQHRPVRVRLNVGTNLNELREGPTIFLGGLDNQWTLKLLAPLRYRFGGSDADSYYIRDGQSSENRQWSVRLHDKMTTVNRDYAIIARVHSEPLGQVVIIAAGIGMSGTAAAGEFLASPAQVKELEQRIGIKNRDHDFEAVLETEIDNGIAGAAKIVALDIR